MERWLIEPARVGSSAPSEVLDARALSCDESPAGSLEARYEIALADGDSGGWSSDAAAGVAAGRLN